MPTFWTSAVIVAAALAVLFLAAVACDDVSEGTDSGMRQVRGQVVEVVPRSITEVETLRVRDEKGREYVFVTEGFVGFTPSHLREHSLFGQTVLVTYREKDGRLVAVRTED